MDHARLVSELRKMASTVGVDVFVVEIAGGNGEGTSWKEGLKAVVQSNVTSLRWFILLVLITIFAMGSSQRRLCWEFTAPPWQTASLCVLGLHILASQSAAGKKRSRSARHHHTRLQL